MTVEVSAAAAAKTAGNLQVRKVNCNSKTANEVATSGRQ